MKLSERDYSHLKGTEVIMIEGSNTYHAVVVGCEYSIGITIESTCEDKNKICLNAAMHKARYDNYNGVFAHIVAKIKRGVIDSAMPDKVIRRNARFDGRGRHSSCAFL